VKLRVLPLLAAGLVAAAPLSTVLGHAESTTGITTASERAAADARAAAPAVTADLPAAIAPVAENLELVGHTDLGARGMNAALAIRGDVAYVGSRTDGKPAGTTADLLGNGIAVVDISDPTAPEVVGEIGPPLQGIEGQTSRELRIWPEADLLIVQNLGSNCSELIHACSVRKVRDNFTFYDISGENRWDPKFVARYEPSRNPHEFYLWQDPADPDRALLWISATSSNRLLITDISGARDGEFVELTNWQVPFPGGRLHSMTPTSDGTETHLAYLTGGYYIIDTTGIVEGTATEPKVVTTVPGHAQWPGEGAHSALRLPGTDVALVTDEVYGDALRALGDHGCPWGWTRFVDISNRERVKVIGEYRLDQNEVDFCTTDVPRPSTSIASHNPTVTDELAFISWHAGGLRVVSFDDPTQPEEVAAFVPEPLQAVVTEDPALTAGQDKVAFWSFPIVQDGLIYVTDVRNGLYVLRYTGPGADEIASIGFLEGNSNLADALRYDPVD
jgi:hypothetical protein